jgi:hypothetical protein
VFTQSRSAHADFIQKFAQGVKILMHSSTEFAEFGESNNENLFTPRPPRLGGEISEPYFAQKPEEP